MSTFKRILPAFQIVKNGDMSQAQIISTVTDISNLDNICMEVVWTGTPTGSFQVQASVSGTNWIPISFTPTAPNGSPGSSILDMNQLSFPKIRLVYNKVSGTGTLNVWIGGKTV